MSRKHGSQFSQTARYRRRPVVEIVDAATAQAWVVDARVRGAQDGAAGRFHPGCIMGALLDAYQEAWNAARERSRGAA